MKRLGATRAGFDTSAGRLRRLSGWLALAAGATLLVADIGITTRSPGDELARMGLGLLTPTFGATEDLWGALANTLAFALLGVALGNLLGAALALVFHRPWVQFGCAFVRAIHELFWALLFIQFLGLGTLTGLLAIALPYAGIFAKVYAEILEETDARPLTAVTTASPSLSVRLYTRLAQSWPHWRRYSLYRLECGLRSSAILGFIGLPTLGFHLETAFSQGLYGQAAALLYLFFGLIAVLGRVMFAPLVPLYLLLALFWLPWEGAFSLSTSLEALMRDWLPAPLRHGGDLGDLLGWFGQLLLDQGLPGLAQTLILSLLALVLSGVLALLLFPLVSPLFLPRQLRLLGHLCLVVLRSIPELLLTFVILLITGPSMLPAILALGLHNGAIVAHLAGHYSAALRLRIDSPGGANRYFYEVLPRIYSQMLAFLFYRWEVIMRESAILGILGLPTLGFYIDSAFAEFHLDRALVLILLTAALNMAFDPLARALRGRLPVSSREGRC